MAERKDPDVARAERSGHSAAKWIIIIAVAVVLVTLFMMLFAGYDSTSPSPATPN